MNQEDGINCEWSSSTIINNTITGNGGWGINSKYSAPLNAGINGTQLMADNPFLGNNGLGKCIQNWTLQVHVLTSGVPWSNAYVQVGTGGVYLWEGSTDGEGYTEIIEVSQYYISNNTTMPTIQNPYLIVVDITYWKLCYVEDNTLVEFDIP